MRSRAEVPPRYQRPGTLCRAQSPLRPWPRVLLARSIQPRAARRDMSVTPPKGVRAGSSPPQPGGARRARPGSRRRGARRARLAVGGADNWGTAAPADLVPRPPLTASPRNSPFVARDLLGGPRPPFPSGERVSTSCRYWVDASRPRSGPRSRLGEAGPPSLTPARGRQGARLRRRCPAGVILHGARGEH